VALLEARAAVAAAANESGTVTGALRACLRELCHALGWPAGRACLLDAKGEVAGAPVWHAAAPERFDAFRAALAGQRPAAGRGAAGRSLAAGKPVWIEDLRRDGTFAASRAGWEAGLRSAVAFPVPAAGGTAAVVELYAGRAEAADPAVLEACAFAGRQLCALVERLREREALRDAADSLREVLDGSPAPVAAFDAAGAVALWTAAAERVLGWSAAEAAAGPAGAGWAGLREAAGRVLQSGEPAVAELAWRRADGAEVELSVHCAPLLAPDGSVRGAVAHLADVGAEREHERLRVAQQVARVRVEALERRARLLAGAGELLEASPDALVHEGAPLLSGLAYLLVPALADFCRVDLLEEDGSLARAALVHTGAQVYADQERHPAHEPDDAHPVLRVARTGAPLLLAEVAPAVRRSLYAAPGAARGLPDDPRALVSVPLRARGRTLGALTVAVTQRGRRLGREDLFLIQDLARRAALALDNARLFGAADAAARWREQVLAIVSHDLRSPLNVISIATGALLRAWPQDPALAPERTQIAMIAQSADRMRGLVGDLLGLAQADAGTFSVEPRPIPVGVLLKRALEAHRALAEQKGVSLAVTRFPACAVRADEQRVYQVFSNLVGNAVAHTPRGGSITLSAAREGGEVRLSVADTGPGIAAEDLPRVFDRFWRAKGAAGRGAGLGLSIARAIVEAHGGAIRADSRPGEGATFTFTLPLAEAE
jgi:PAS domain S-box-containing protein